MFCVGAAGSPGCWLKLLNAGTLLEAVAVNAGGKDRFCVGVLGVLMDASGSTVTWPAAAALRP